MSVFKDYLEGQEVAEKRVQEVNEVKLGPWAHLEVLVYLDLKVMKANKDPTESLFVFISHFPNS